MNTQRQRDGDTGFLGIDAHTHPRLLSPGIAADASNKTFRRQKAETRSGMHTVLFGTRRTMSFDAYEFPWVFNGYAGLGTVYGSAIFGDPGGYEYGLIATARGTWLLRVNTEPTFINLPYGDDQISGPVVMVQAFNKMMMFRGSNQSALICDPVADAEWSTVVQTNARNSDADNSWGDGTSPLPNGETAAHFSNRVFVAVGRDEIAVSDIFDYTRYSRTTQRFFINWGSSDYTVRIFPYNQTTLVVFKRNSLFLVGNVYGNLSDITNDLIPGNIGCVAHNTVVAVGRDVYFLSDGGVYTVAQSLDNKPQLEAVPFTRPVQPYIDRVNWAVAHKAQAAVHNSFYYLALPIDGSTHNNIILVFDFLNGNWCGAWQHDYLDAAAFMMLKSPAGKTELYVIMGDSHADDTVHGSMWKMNDGFEDRLFNTPIQIADELLSRGFSASKADSKTLRLSIEQETWNPQFTITIETDGVNETLTLEDAETKSRTESYNALSGAADEFNLSGLHGAPYRKDYSIELPGDDQLDFDDFEFDAYVFQRGLMDGANPQAEQAVTERYALTAEDRLVQVRISNAQGRANQRALLVEQINGRTTTGTQL